MLRKSRNKAPRGPNESETALQTVHPAKRRTRCKRERLGSKNKSSQTRGTTEPSKEQRGPGWVAQWLLSSGPDAPRLQAQSPVRARRSITQWMHQQVGQQASPPPSSLRRKHFKIRNAAWTILKPEGALTFNICQNFQSIRLDVGLHCV